MANEMIFETRAKEYAKGRPSYAPAAIERILQNFPAEGTVIADVGSGTGIFSNELMSRGYEVYCIEPNEAMRAAAEKRFFGNTLFHSVAATAENTGLPDHAVSLITAASAFHWFDTGRFYEECKRILKPGGTVCILANARRTDDFTEKQNALCRKYCDGFESLTHGIDKSIRLAESFFAGEFLLERFDFPLAYTKEKFITRSLSSSYSPAKGTREYDEYQCELKALLDESFSDNEITVANDTVMLRGKISG